MRLALLGDPVAHSRSPIIHRAAMRVLGISGSFEARRTDDAGVAAACAEMRSGILDGANVTMPLKGVALGVVDRASEMATRAGAVNTLSMRGGLVYGDNTDVGGIRDVWDRRQLPDSAPVLVLGAGGAAAAVLLACADSELLVSSRRVGLAMAVAIRLGVDATEVAWGVPVSGAVVVNATPLGMGGESLPAGVVENAAGLFDMAYGALPTPAVTVARHLRVVDGIDMLVAQAARSFQIWSGFTAPIEVMENAARTLKTAN